MAEQQAEKCPKCERPKPLCECLPPEDCVVGVCPCGRPLYPSLDAVGRRIGVTHTAEDELPCNEFFASLRISRIDAPNCPEEKRP